MDSIYEIIMDLPLFKGVSREKISELVEKNRFHFLKYTSNELMISAGDPCKHVRFVISGKARIEISSSNKKILISEVISAPNVIGPDYLFGKETYYPFSVYAEGNCGLLQIDKADYINILLSDKVFLFNILNSLSRNYQKVTNGILSLSSGSIAERLAFLVVSLTQKGAEDIRLKFKQKDFCSMLSTQRTSFVNALNALKEEGAIDFTSTEIIIKNREKMLEILHASEE